MVILGVGDGLDAGAALVVDDHPVAVESQARLDRCPRSRAFPWGAVDAVLQEAGLRERDVDLIAVAGRFTPPLLVRKHPGLRRVARDAFSPALEASVLVQALLKESGFGAMEADRAQEWLEQRFVDRGFRPERVVLVDIHKCLASAAYRTQPADPLTIVTVHPMGDGVACAVHRAGGGQLDRVFEQKGFATLHVHLQRCAAAMGLEPVIDDDRMWAAAARGAPDPSLVALLHDELRVEGARLGPVGRILPASPSERVYQALAAAPASVAAASVVSNLTDVIREWVAHHLAAHGGGDVAVAGALFDNPRLVAALAELDAVHRLWLPPEPGWGGLPLGAAISLGGLHARPLAVGLGRDHHPRQLRAALDAAGVSWTEPADLASRVADALANGNLVGRFAGPAGFGRHGAGTRSVLVRADDPSALRRAREALALTVDDEPLVVCRSGSALHARVEWAEVLAGPLRHGGAAVALEGSPASVAAVQAADGRVVLQVTDAELDPGLDAVVRACESRGVGALAVFALARGQEPVTSVPADAVQVARAAGLDLLAMGPYLGIG